MLLTFSVYSARSLGDAEEKATKIIRDFLRERKKFEYTLEVLNVSGHAADLDFETYVFNVEFQANINLKPLIADKFFGEREYRADALRLVG